MAKRAISCITGPASGMPSTDTSARDEAVQHAINAREWSWAADLIEQAPPAPTWDFNVLEKQRHWLEKLPPEVLHARPRLCFTYARTLHMVAPPTETEAWLQVAEAASAALLSASAAESGSPAALATADEARCLLGEVAALRAVHISVYQGDGQAALAFCQQALALLPNNISLLVQMLPWLSVSPL